QQAVRPELQGARQLEFAVARALLAPFPQQLSPGGIRRHLMGVPEGDIDVPLRVHGTPSGVGLKGERPEEFPLGRELLHALVLDVAGVDHVVLADGEANIREEFAVLLAAASPGEQEAEARWLLLLRRGYSLEEEGEASGAGAEDLSARHPPTATLVVLIDRRHRNSPAQALAATLLRSRLA